MVVVFVVVSGGCDLFDKLAKRRKEQKNEIVRKLKVFDDVLFSYSNAHKERRYHSTSNNIHTNSSRL